MGKTVNMLQPQIFIAKIVINKTLITLDLFYMH